MKVLRVVFFPADQSFACFFPSSGPLHLEAAFCSRAGRVVKPSFTASVPSYYPVRLPLPPFLSIFQICSNFLENFEPS